LAVMKVAPHENAGAFRRSVQNARGQCADLNPLGLSRNRLVGRGEFDAAAVPGRSELRDHLEAGVRPPGGLRDCKRCPVDGVWVAVSARGGAQSSTLARRIDRAFAPRARGLKRAGKAELETG
jgi:hypothetical protein